MKEDFSIGKVTAKHGEKSSGFLPVVNSETEIPITLITGLITAVFGIPGALFLILLQALF